MTDIDAVVFDRIEGVIGIFQLKWQDFNIAEVKQQRSRAKDFVSRVDAWATAISDWIAEFGLEALCRVLQISPVDGIPVTNIRLFAIGRSAARFKSYGYQPSRPDVAHCTWAQFLRLRYEIGPVENVITRLHDAIRTESNGIPRLDNVSQEIVAAGQSILFEDFWFECE